MPLKLILTALSGLAVLETVLGVPAFRATDTDQTQAHRERQNVESLTQNSDTSSAFNFGNKIKEPFTFNPPLQPSLAMSQTGIEGQITLGPIRPVQRLGETNNHPYSATITVLNSDGVVVAEVQSDTSGSFRLNLAPGTYTLHPESSAARPRARDQVVTVPEAGFVTVQIQYDTGIR